MANGNRIKIRHGTGIPATDNLLPYELGWDGSTLYINNGATTPAVIPIAGARFAGSTNITTLGTITTGTWKGSKIGDNYLGYGDTNLSGTFSHGDIFFNEYLRPNRFSGTKASAVTIEYSDDGGATWNDYGATDIQKQNLFTSSQSFRIAGPNGSADNANCQLRITLATTNNIYTTLYKLHLYISTNYSQNCKVTIKAAKQNDPTNYTLIICENQSISGWSGWNVINYSNGFTTYGNSESTQYGFIQFIFTHTGLSDISKTTAGLTVSRIYGYGGVGWKNPSNMAATGHVYTYNGAMETTFPAKVISPSLTIGSSNNTGNIAIYNNNGKYGYIVPSTFTSNRTLTLPDATGTIALTNSNITGTAANVTGTVAIANGGTGATSESDARTNLGLGKSLWTGDWQGVDTTITVNGIRNYQMFIVHFKQTNDTGELGTSALVFLTQANGQYYFRGEGGYNKKSEEIRIYISAELNNNTLTLISCYQINTSGTRVNRAVSEIIGII